MSNIFVNSFASLKDVKKEPFSNKLRNKVFSIMFKQSEKYNTNMFLSRLEYYNSRKKELKKAWVLKNDKWQKVFNQKVNLMYYHGKNENSYEICKNINLKVVNDPKFELICDDKIKCYNFFPEITPKSFLINNHYELAKALKLIETEKVVLKPRFGSYGNGVIIINKKDLRNGITKNTILQEFIDSSNGLTGMGIKKVHDLRVVVINGKIDHCYARIPKNGSLISNVTRGASKIYFSPSEIHSKIRLLLKKIDSEAKQFNPRIYSADFMMDINKNFWLVEMNSKPGTLYYDDKPRIRKRYYSNVIKVLTKAI